MFDNYKRGIRLFSDTQPVHALLDLSRPVMHDDRMTTDGLQRLAEAIKRRRTELGLTQGGLAERGGPSMVLVGQLERAQQPNPQPLTFHRLDVGLGWEEGSAAGILRGETPRIANQQPAGHGGKDYVTWDDLGRVITQLRDSLRIERIVQGSAGYTFGPIDPDATLEQLEAMRAEAEARLADLRAGRLTDTPEGGT